MTTHTDQTAQYVGSRREEVEAAIAEASAAAADRDAAVTAEEHALVLGGDLNVGQAEKAWEKATDRSNR